MKRKLIELGIIVLFYLLQVTLGRNIAIAGIMPNFMIILPLLFGYIHGSNEGMYVGIISGLLYDVFFTGLFGFSALVFVILGYVSGLFKNQFEENNFVPPIIITSVGVFVFEFLMFIGNFLLQNRVITPFFIGRIIMPELVYTVLIAIALYKPLCILNRYLDRKNKVKEADETIF